MAEMLRKDEFINSVAHQNEFVFTRNILRYQYNILTNNSLSVVSPFTGKIVHATRTYVYPDFKIAYQFDSTPPFWLLIDELRLGFPISEISYDGRAFRIDSGSLIETGGGWVPAAEQRGSSYEIPKPMLIIGERNFAHHLWNELGGFERLLDIINPKSIDIVPTMQPFGKIENIFNLDHDIVRDFEYIGGRHYTGLVTRIGSTFVSKSLREKVIKNCDSHFKTPTVSRILDLISGCFPVLWMTFRNEGRACENESEMLICLAKQFLKTYSNSAILLDGFSFPADIDGHHFDKARLRFESYATSFGHEIDKICKSVPRIISVNGLKIPESIILARKAHYYISSAGTIQHKIGWLHNKPGYIHTCSSGLTESSRRWWAAQIEDGRLPTIAPVELIEDTSPSSTHERAARNMNYRITNIHEFVHNVMDDIYRHIVT
jgi:hypothetical protein